MSGEGKVVCVTGASGFIASWLVKLLLHRGYTVHATVRSLKDPNKVAHLVAFDGAKERLHLFEADLLKEKSFDSAIDGCEGVFHTASPVSISPLATKQWYILSKILAEEAAWKYAEENGIDLVLLHPTLVIGPILQPTLSTSNQIFLDLVKKGKDLVPSEIYSFVDVRDVVDAHVQAFELPSASGRYCLVGTTMHSSKALKIIGELYPSLAIPEKYEDSLLAIPSYQVSQEKAKSLGINFTPFEVSLRDTVESLIEKNFLNL